MKAIVSVLGKDKKGIIAKVSNALYEQGINIEDISQTVLQDRVFTMIMMVDIPDDTDISVVSENMNALANCLEVEIRVQHEDIFSAMHRI